MEEKLVKIGKNTVSYWDNSLTSYEKAIVLLPSGASSGEKFIRFIKYFSDKHRLIIPDYPGRGRSEPLQNTKDLITGQAKAVSGLIHHLKLKNVTVVAVSYGTAILNQIVNLTDLNSLNKIVLLAPGEYYGESKRIFYKILFTPAKYSERLRKIYKLIVNKYSHNLIYEGIDLKNILEQWYSILDYKISNTRPIETETVIVVLEKDSIVDKRSLGKIYATYPKHVIKSFNMGHPSTDNELELLFRRITKYV